MNKFLYLLLLTIISCTNNLYSMGMEIYDRPAHMRQYRYEQALRARPPVRSKINELRPMDRAVVKLLNESEEPFIRQALTHYSNGSFEDRLREWNDTQKNRLYLLLLAYKRRIARKEDQGLVTSISTMASPVGLLSAGGGLVTGVTLALSRGFLEHAGMTLAQKIAFFGLAGSSGVALYGGLIVSTVATPVAIGCKGYEYYKWNRVHNAAELIREQLDIESLPEIRETT